MTGSRPSPAWWVGGIDPLRSQQAAQKRPYLEFLRSPSLSAGIYVLPAGAQDPQKPHAQDELYIVRDGDATLEIAGERRRVGPGAVAFISAGVPHRFLDIRSGLVVLVVFAPPETEAV